MSCDEHNRRALDGGDKQIADLGLLGLYAALSTHLLSNAATGVPLYCFEIYVVNFCSNSSTTR
jgi:hypothetical protein